MAEIALPRHQSLTGPAFQPQNDDHDGNLIPVSNQPGPGLPSTYDPFLFPYSSNCEDNASSISPVKLSSTAHLNGGIPQHRGHNRTRNSMHALPSFNFNATNITGLANEPSSAFLVSEQEAPSTPTRTSRHRRIASEHINGAVPGVVRLRSRSPLKSEVTGPPTDLSPPSGHRHRRSGAISSQDLKSAVRPTSPSSPNSALVSRPDADTPSDLFSSSPNRERSLPLPITRTTSDETRISDHDSSTIIPRPRLYSQPRVGFSDTVEFIPRPLSTISSETESSMSTLRGHSVAGSISSVLSGGTTSPSMRISSSVLPPTVEVDVPPPRPKSAGLIMDRSYRGLMNITHDLTHLRRPLSASSSLISPKAQITNLNDAFAFGNSTQGFPTRKDPPKSRGMRTWANSLVQRRPKSPGDHDATSSYPTNFDDKGLNMIELLSTPETIQFSENFDEDPTATILHDIPTFVALHPTRNDLNPNASNLVEPSGPMIDLDVAQAPLSSSGSTNYTYGLKNRSFSNARYSMHSSGSTGCFTGPGMHYHRRSESAPQLVAMELDRPTLRRLGSSSSTEAVHEMEDVFEEDEEDGETPKTKGGMSQALNARQESAENSMAKTESVENIEDWSPTKRPRSLPRPISSRTNRPARPASNRTTRSYEIPKSSMMTDKDVVLDQTLQDAVMEHRLPTSPDAPATAAFGEVSKSTSITGTMPLVFIPHGSNPTTPTDSIFLSPHSPYNLPYSLSTPTFETSGTSLTESRKYSAYGPGESCSEFRPSVDDVPSLISSRSGFTSATHTHIPSVSSRHHDDGAASFISFNSATPASDPRWKRASIASLSRLVNFGEKSKLSTEQSAAGASASLVKSKSKKSRRLSRMLQFWKAKEPIGA